MKILGSLSIGFVLSALCISSSTAYTGVDEILKTDTSNFSKPVTQKRDIDEFCLFGCKKYSIENNNELLFSGVNDLYEVLKNKYGLDNEIKCRPYRTEIADISLRTRMKIESLNNPGVLYSDEVFKNFDNSFKQFYQGVNHKLGDNSQRMLFVYSDLYRDIYRDYQDITSLNNPDLDQDSRLKLIDTFKNRHRFIAKSCGDKFLTAYDQYLNNLGKVRADKFQELKEVKAQQEIQRQQEELAHQEKLRLAEEEAQRERQSSYQRSIAAAEKQRNIQQCKNSNVFQLYKAADDILDANRLLALSHNAIKQEEAKEKIGGVSDLSKRYNASTIMLSAKENQSRAFSKYRQLGGKANNPLSVQKLNNPCE